MDTLIGEIREAHDVGVRPRFRSTGKRYVAYFLENNPLYNPVRAKAHEDGYDIDLVIGNEGRPRARLFRLLRGGKELGILHMVHITSLHINGGGKLCAKTGSFNRRKLRRSKFFGVYVDAPLENGRWQKLFIIKMKTFLRAKLRFVLISLERYVSGRCGRKPKIDWYDHEGFRSVNRRRRIRPPG
jgi:hypothetical protein